MIEVRNLTKRYGNKIAVNNLSFTMEKGKIYGFLGVNGAGKSTTMNMMTGYLAPTEGTVLIDGLDISKQAEKAKEKLGYLPEIPPVYPDMTVYEYLSFAADLRKIPKKEREERIEEVMEKTGISEVEERLIKNLSKGYRQRVGLAQALIHKPEILILDEPTVGLDPKQMQEIRDLIRNLKEEHTVILSSHILSEVSAVCDRIIILSKGSLLADDTPEGLKENMTGKRELLLTVKSEKEKLESILNDIPEIIGYEWEESELTNSVKIRLKIKEKEEIRERFSETLFRQEILILGMEMKENSLEDIFLSLTQEGEHDSDL